MLPLIGAGLSAIGGIFGARSQANAQRRQLAAEQQRFNAMQSLINGQMQNGPNPYAQQLMGLFGQNPQLQQPGQAQAFTYDPSMLGAAPQIDTTFGAQAPTVQGASVAAPAGLSMPTLPGAVAAPIMDAPGSIAAPTVAGPSFGEAFNVGQDSLMQMLRRDLGPSMDTGLQQNLQSLYGPNSTFDASTVIDALRPIDQRLIDEQASQLRGGAGSLGQRFGSAMLEDERKLRENFLQDVGARNAGLMQNAFESGQNRRIQALGMGQQQQQFLSQFPLQAMQAQAGVAGQLLGNELQSAQLGQTAQLANASNQLQAAGIDTNALLQTSLANQQSGLQAGLANQQAGLQGAQLEGQLGMFGAEQALQAALANAGYQQQAGLANQQMAGQFGLAEADQLLRAALANQQMTGQYGLANQGAMNQAGQFNAGQQMAAQGQNMNQANIFNQMLMGGIGQAAGLQNQQQGMNNQLIGMLGGMQTPQQQASPWGQAISGLGENLMMLPLLQQVMGGFGGGRQQINPPSPLQIGNIGTGINSALQRIQFPTYY